jgi:hypothetical protein
VFHRLSASDRLRDRDLLTGVVLVAIGGAALVLGADLTVGTAAEMGEGYVPRAMAIALVGLGALIAALALRRSRPSPSASGIGEPRSRLRPLLFVIAAILVFVAALERLGLLAAIAATVTTATFAGEPLRARTLVALIVVLGVAIVLVFVWALGLPLNVFPRAS